MQQIIIKGDIAYDTETLSDWGIDVNFEIEEEEKEVVEDEVPEEVETKCKLGDIWQLGEHRLMCGDSTKVDDVEKLMNGEKADISFQSPPYNVGANIGYKNKQSKYINDDDNKNDYLEFLLKFTNNSINNAEYTFVNIQQLANNKIDIVDYLHKMKNLLSDTIIWDKGNGVPNIARKVMSCAFEYIFIFNKNAKRAIGVKDWQGTVSNIIRVGHQSKNDYSKIHNATFPIELPKEIINNFTNNNSIVLELFGGTGTTLIACEQLNRKCYTMELDEHYCDVIITRWENLTGKKAVKID